MEDMYDFPEAIRGILTGKKWARDGFPRSSLFVRNEYHAEFGYLIIMTLMENFKVPWTPTQNDMKAKDWYRVP